MAEATETTETTTETTEQAPVEATTAAPETSTETTAEESTTPDVGEAIQQMQSQMASLASRLPEPEAEPDILSGLTAPVPEEELGFQQPGQEATQQAAGEEGDSAAEIRQLLGEAVQEQMQPYFVGQEVQKREEALRAYADQHPNLKGEALDEVSARLESMGLQPQPVQLPNGQMVSVPPDPQHVDLVYKAYEAELASSGSGTPAEAASGEGATIETGAGPGAPEEEVDPQTQAWMNAIQNGASKDVFSQ